MLKRKSVSLLLTVLVAFGMLSVSGLYQGVQAAPPYDATPTVTVILAASLTVTPLGMTYGSRAPGDYIPYTEGGGHKVTVTVSANTNTWSVKCSKSQNLTSGSYSIPSANFKYSSLRISGAPTNPIVYGPLEFGTDTNVVNPPATPAPADTLVVDVQYDLTIGTAQYAASGYTATHTYTLTAT